MGPITREEAPAEGEESDREPFLSLLETRGRAELARSVPGHTGPAGPALRVTNLDSPRDTEAKSRPQSGEQALQ